MARPKPLTGFLGLALALALGPAAAQGVGASVTADELVALFADRLAEEVPEAELGGAQFELESARLALEPRLTLQQQAGWRPGSPPHASLSAAVTVPVIAPGGAAQLALAEHRLAVAAFDSAARKAVELVEFRRILRVLAHLDEVLELLEAASRAATRTDGSGPATVAELELGRALIRTRAERELLADRVSRLLPASEAFLRTGGRPGRPSVRGASGSFDEVCGDEHTAAGRRAELILGEELLIARAQRARLSTSLSVALRGGVEYRPGDGWEDPWSAGVAVALDVSLPLGNTSADASVDFDGEGVNQAISLRFPRGAAPPVANEAEAVERYEEALAEAEEAGRRAWLEWQDALLNLQIRRLELAGRFPGEAFDGPSAPSGSVTAESPRELQTAVDLLGAELDVDLALLSLERACAP